MRSTVLKFRVTQAEKAAILARVEATGMTVSDFLRGLALNSRIRKTEHERAKLLQLARLGNNVNQLARWANTYKESAKAEHVLYELEKLQTAIAGMADDAD